MLGNGRNESMARRRNACLMSSHAPGNPPRRSRRLLRGPGYVDTRRRVVRRERHENPFRTRPPCECAPALLPAPVRAVHLPAWTASDQESPILSLSSLPLPLSFLNLRSRKHRHCLERAPRILWRITQQLTRLANGEQRFKRFDLTFQWHAGEDLCQQFAAGLFHDGIRRRDDKHLGPRDAGFQSQTATLRDITCIDIAPQVPLTQARVLRKGGETFVVVRLHDIRETQSNKWNTATAIELTRHLLADNLRERVTRFRI